MASALMTMPTWPRCVIAAGAVAMVAACGSGNTKSTDASAAMTGRGPVTLATNKDTSGNMRNQVNTWNKAHPKEPVRIIELPEDADTQRQQMVQNAQAKSDAYSILNIDVVWTSEFAANRYIVPIPGSGFDLSKFLGPPAQTSQYRGRLFAVPYKTDAGLLFYRTDLLKKAGVSAPPKTWAELKSDCAKVQATPAGKGVGCYGGQFEKYEGLTADVAEVINGAGGVITDENGRPNVNTPQAKQGLGFLVDGFKSGMIPKEAITYKEEEGRRAFEAGKLIFHRQWPYQWALAEKKDGSSKVVGKFDVAPLPGLSGRGVPSLGGHDLAISSFAKNKATALDVIKYLTSPDAERANLLATSEAPTIAALYDDQSLVQKFPYLPVLHQSILNARPRPKVVRYGEVTAAIQAAAYNAITGKTSTDQALADLQNKLTQLTKQ